MECGVDIEIFSDVVCPWCWIGEQKVLAAVSGFTTETGEPVKLRWRAFQLDPSATSEGIPLVQWLGRRYGGEDNAKRMFTQVTSVGREVGLTMNFDQAISANTLDAHRLIWWAGRDGADQRPMVEALHQAHFTDGQDIGSLDTLVSVAAGLGHDSQLVREFLESPGGLEEVQEDLAMGRELGITGVPTFVFAGKYAISGAQDPSTLREVLDEVLRREGRSPLTVLAPQGATCDDDSCAV
ncbi:MAG: DsbA family oxidoreductase [Hamadaea sp.]|nr:DsbA family oxidoreductase [Hamadaea sp.]NUR48089.1 DsbA family oxidoreductase [Hamadaea sp.]NUT04731.1 DsbA family oxidoreductase [Hamadaea sp.]